MKKRWYDFLWIASLLYLVLGFFNILFAWLGLLCFFIPLVIAFAGGDKGYCNRFCGRGQLFSLLGGRFGLSRGASCTLAIRPWASDARRMMSSTVFSIPTSLHIKCLNLL